jgi:hypothetical protein
MKAESANAHEFGWGIPEYGYVLGRLGGHEIYPDRLFGAGDFIVQAAAKPEDLLCSTTVASATDRWREWYEEQPAEFPVASSIMREASERMTEDRSRRTTIWDWETARIFYPLKEETGFFRMFAEIEPNPEGILAFANRYGNLMFHGCSVLVWQEEVLAMRRALRVWDLLDGNDVAGLREQFRWRKFADLVWDFPDLRCLESYCNKDQWLIFDSHPHMAAGKRPPFPDRRAIEAITRRQLPQQEWDNLLKKRDPAAAANAYLRLVIHPRFKAYVGSTLSWVGDRSLAWEPVPKNLLGAIWLQFQGGIAASKKYHTCLGPGCRKWFEVSPGVTRSDARYCTEKCRVRAYQNRRKRALEMWDEGKSDKQIAKELGTHVETVQGWRSRGRWEEKRDARDRKRR